MKKIVICADGTWNRPEKNSSKDFPSNVLRLARAIQPHGSDNTSQQVFYDWGIGSYYDPIIKNKHSHPSREIAFVGAWDTVGSMGIPISFLGLFSDSDEFYDTKLGKNTHIARHVLAIDEQRSDFIPTIWQPRPNLDLKQVWFAGSHSDIGGSYKPDKDGSLLADNSA